MESTLIFTFVVDEILERAEKAREVTLRPTDAQLWPTRMYLGANTSPIVNTFQVGDIYRLTFTKVDVVAEFNDRLIGVPSHHLDEPKVSA